MIVEIKTTKFTHQDIGQLQMYVNYYDRYKKKDFENPTIGILLCAEKNNAVVKISLPENNKTIIASEYKLYLPKVLPIVRTIICTKLIIQYYCCCLRCGNVVNSF